MKNNVIKILILCFVIALFCCALFGCTSQSSEQNSVNDSNSVNFIDPDDPDIEFVSNAESFKISYNNSNFTATIDKYVGNSAYIKIPSKVTYNNIEYTITKIGDMAFWNNPSDNADDFPEPLYIGIPNTVTEIEKYAFAYCSMLKEITVPNSVKTIGTAAFTGCSQLVKMQLPFVGNALEGTENTHFGFIFGAPEGEKNESYLPSTLREVIITGGTRIDEYAFAYCRKFSSIILPDTIDYIGQYAFFWCEGLTSLVFPDNVKTVGRSSLNGCSHLVDLQMPFVGERLNGYFANIGYAFGTNVCENNAQYMPSTLRTVIITKQTEFKSRAFYGLSNLTKIEIPSNITSIGDDVFYGCKSLEYNVKNGIRYIGNSVDPCILAVGVENPDAIESVVLEETCVSIESNAFSMCSLLTDISIPSTVNKIGSYAFYRCTNLKSVTISDEVTKISDGAFYECRALEQVNISPQSNITSIGSFAFYNCNSLKSLYIPDSVSNIYYCAFKGSKIDKVELESLTAYLAITFDGIYSTPFAGAKSLVIDEAVVTNLVIPESVEEINSYAFSFMTFVSSVTIPQSVTSLGDCAFYGFTSEQTIVLSQDASAYNENDWKNNNFAIIA